MFNIPPSWSAVNAVKMVSPEKRKQISKDLRQSACIRYILETVMKCPWLLNEDVFAYREYQRQNPPQGLYDDFLAANGLAGLDLPKCNQRAAQVRQEGNALFAKKNYSEAIMKYNESICWARGDSEDLGIGFANRSAINVEMHEYEFALRNIKLARQHNYPQRLLPKLEVRERNCREKIAAAENACSKQCPKLTLTADINPSIPFLARGVAAGDFPRFGRGLKAETDFKVGDVILQERPAVVTAVGREGIACHHCGSENQALIPCPQCVSVMFCSEECVQNGWKEFHRFECGISDKLRCVPFGANRAGLKIFFLGLTQFNDSVKDMMAYCRENGRNGNDPFGLDWTEPNPMETFKQFHTVKVRTISSPFIHLSRSMTVLLYTIYLELPLIQSLFTTEAQRDFFLQSMDDYMLMANQMNIGQWSDRAVELFTFASLLNHSCDANAHAVYSSGMLKLIVQRPIRKGDQICVQYAGEWKEEQQGDFEMAQRVTMAKMDFDCVCEVCDPTSVADRKRRNTNNPPQPKNFRKHMAKVGQTYVDESCTNEEKLDAAEKFLRRYAHLHPQLDFHAVLLLYQDTLQTKLENEMLALARQRALEAGN